jgi:CubicO group peptidase (beta-lactamase class C family)
MLTPGFGHSAADAITTALGRISGLLQLAGARAPASIRTLVLIAAALVGAMLGAGLGLNLAYLHATRHVPFAPDAAAGAAESAFDQLTASLAARGTSALVVLRHGRLLHEWYRPRLHLVPVALRRQSIASMVKGAIGGVSLALLAQEGLIGLDDPIGTHVPEWRQDAARSRLTLRQLATHSAGLKGARRKDDDEWGREYMSGQRHRVALALQTPLVGEPGAIVAYSNPAFTLLGYAMSHALHASGQGDLSTFLRDRLMRPLGVPDGAWRIGYGTPIRHGGVLVHDIAGGGSFTARALARLGGLIAAGGTWDGRQIVDRRWLEEMSTPTTAALPVGCRERREPTAALGWWVNRNGAWPSAPADTMVAAGSGHQVLVVIPSLGLTVVRFGQPLGTARFRGDYWQAFEESLLNPLLEALCSLPDEGFPACTAGGRHGHPITGPARSSPMP